MTGRQSEAGRKSYLDGLRGVAATIVLFAHSMIAFLPSVVTFSEGEGHHYWLERGLGLSPLGWIWNGEFAVCIFFVLSGYVLSDFCSRTRISFPAQVVRRYFRLALPMLITSFFAYFLMKIGAYKNYAAATEVTRSGWLSMWYRGFDASFFDMVYEAVYGAFIKGSAAYNSNLWTMKIELVGSFYIFLVRALFDSRTLRGAVLCVFIFLNYNNFYSLFAFGALFYDWEDLAKQIYAKLIPDDQLRERVAFFGCLFGTYAGAYPHVQPGMTAPWHFFLPYSGIYTLGWHMIGSVVLVFSLLSSSTVQGWLSGAKAQFLGRVSFVLYLIHLPIICSLGAGLALLLKSLPYYLNVAISAPLTISAAFFAAHLLYRFIDIKTTALSRDSGLTVDRIFERTPNEQFYQR